MEGVEQKEQMLKRRKLEGDKVWTYGGKERGIMTNRALKHEGTKIALRPSCLWNCWENLNKSMGETWGGDNQVEWLRKLKDTAKPDERARRH